MIHQIQQDTQGAVSAMGNGTEKVESGVQLVDKTGTALAGIADAVMQTADMIRQIAVATEEQSTATQQIAGDLESIARTSKETATGVNESAKASHDLSLLAAELQGLVSSFRVSPGGLRTPVTT